jgi:hypothetical protein
MIGAVGTPEEISQTLRAGLIYIVPPLAPPLDVLTFTAISSRGATAFASLPVEVRPSHWAAWQATFFAPSDLDDPSKEAAVWGMEAAPAGDGIPNLIKFDLSLGPYSPVPEALLRPFVGDGGHSFGVEVFHRNDVPGLTNLFEWSTDLTQWVAGAGHLEPAQVTPAGSPSELDRLVVKAVKDTGVETRGFVRRKVVLGTPPVMPDPDPPPPPFTPAILSQARSQLAGLHRVDPSSSTPAQRAAARAALRQSHGTVYGQLSQTLSLPSNCAQIGAIETISNDGLILDTLSAFVDRFEPGGQRGQDHTGTDGQKVRVGYRWSNENGQNQLVFTSPYNNRFRFNLSYYDVQGGFHQQTLECPGSVDETGAAVAEDDCSRPYFGWPLILISGLAVSRFETGGTDYTDVVDLVREAIQGMGGTGKTDCYGTTTQYREGGARFFYGVLRAQQTDICPAELLARLKVIAASLGATVVREGNVYRIQGPDAGGRNPNRFLGPWFD